MANRLRDIIPKLISVKQDGFVKEKQIIDGIITMHEIIHSLKFKKEEHRRLMIESHGNSWTRSYRKLALVRLGENGSIYTS